MTWYYKNQPIAQLPDDCVGFVYLITNKVNRKKYIGKKLAKFAKTTYKMILQKNGKKVKKRIRSAIPSDWEEYWGSCDALTKDILAMGNQYFRREILHFCTSKSQCNYLEAREQFDRRVLETSNYYNGHISVRVHGSHVLGKVVI
jgi:hypothetical protein